MTDQAPGDPIAPDPDEVIPPHDHTDQPAETGSEIKGRAADPLEKLAAETTDEAEEQEPS